jgi:thiol:disulfide interchange protein DsbD
MTATGLVRLATFNLSRGAFAALAATVLTVGPGHAARAQSGGQDAAAAFDDFQNTKAKDIKPQDVIHWDALEAQVRADGSVEVGARLRADQGWTIYKKNLEFSGGPGFEVVDVKPPPSQRITDPISGEEVDVYSGGEFFVTMKGPLDPARDTLQFAAKYVGCTKVICLFPYTEQMTARLLPPPAAETATAPAPAPTPVEAATPATPGDGTKIETAPPAAAAAAAAPGEEDLQSRLARQLTDGGLSFGMLLALVFFGGLISNLTPCVYPMIPITLRLLARQGRSPYLSASYYALGIVVTYSALGLFAVLSGSLFGSLLASKTFNVAFAAIMATLGVTMLGFGDFSKLQMLGNKLGDGAPSPKNTFLMGTGAGLVAAPCTGPILAALLAYTAKNAAGLGPSVGLLFTYSLGFALPYVLLGGAAAKVSKVRVAPQVQIGVKLFFASVMFGLTLYYLRVPFYNFFTELKPHWQAIATVGGVAGLVLAAVWVIVPSLQNNKLSMILPTAVLGVGIFGASQYLTSNSSAAAAAHDSVVWHHAEADAFAAAKASGKPVLIDMWAEWCEACKKMDGSTFIDPLVLSEIGEGWVTLKMDLTEDTPATQAIQEKYGLLSLPTLVLLPPDADVAKRFNVVGYVNSATLINNLRQFGKKPAE